MISTFFDLLVAAPQPETGWGMPRDVSLDGWRIDWLINITTVFVGILFVIMCVWMVYAAIKHNQHHEAEYDHGSSKRSVTVALVISALIFFVVDGNLFVNAINDLSVSFWNFGEVDKNPATVKVEVNAHQWAWDFRYPGPDGQFNTPDDVVMLNHLRVPVGTPVSLQMGSTDVIHSLYLPNFRVKTDAVPGMINRLWFQAKETGDFDIGCAQHCGTNHYKMKGLLTVLPKEEFEAWYSVASTDAKRYFDPEDKEALWGWEWRKI
jgi:cytochrome c oxidase subunit 2